MKIFLDMDGVLADLFGFVAQEIHQKPYKALTLKEKIEAKKIWTTKSEATKFFKKHGGVQQFFANLPTFEDKTIAVVNTAVSVAGEYKICSRPASIDRDESKKGKLSWIKRHLSPQPTEILFPQNKAMYAIDDDDSPNILVDDFPPYIKHWRDAGGVAIEMRTDSFRDAQTLSAFLEKQLTVAFSNQISVQPVL